MRWDLTLSLVRLKYMTTSIPWQKKNYWLDCYTCTVLQRIRWNIRNCWLDCYTGTSVGENNLNAPRWVLSFSSLLFFFLFLYHLFHKYCTCITVRSFVCHWIEIVSSFKHTSNYSCLSAWSAKWLCCSTHQCKFFHFLYVLYLLFLLWYFIHSLKCSFMGC